MAGGSLVPHVTWCSTHGRKAFLKQDAKRLIRQLGGNGMREYRCDVLPNLWHAGHLPQAALYGRKTVSEVYSPPDSLAA